VPPRSCISRWLTDAKKRLVGEEAYRRFAFVFWYGESIPMLSIGSFVVFNINNGQGCCLCLGILWKSQRCSSHGIRKFSEDTWQNIIPH